MFTIIMIIVIVVSIIFTLIWGTLYIYNPRDFINNRFQRVVVIPGAFFVFLLSLVECLLGKL